MASVITGQLVTTIANAVKDAPPFMLTGYFLLSLFVLTQIVGHRTPCTSNYI